MNVRKAAWPTGCGMGKPALLVLGLEFRGPALGLDFEPSLGQILWPEMGLKFGPLPGF